MAWRSLRHANILPLLGVTMSENQFVTVSMWMENGNIKDFVKEHPDVNPLDLVCILFKAITLSCH